MGIWDYDSSAGEMGTYEPLPKGKYSAIISAATEQPTKKGDGKAVKFVLDIQDAAYKGKKLFVYSNLENPNPQTVLIGKQERNSMLKAMGKENSRISGPNDFCNTLMTIEVDVVADDYRGGFTNKIVKYHKYERNAPSAATSTGEPNF